MLITDATIKPIIICDPAGAKVKAPELGLTYRSPSAHGDGVVINPVTYPPWAAATALACVGMLLKVVLETGAVAVLAPGLDPDADADAPLGRVLLIATLDVGVALCTPVIVARVTVRVTPCEARTTIEVPTWVTTVTTGTVNKHLVRIEEVTELELTDHQC